MAKDLDVTFWGSKRSEVSSSSEEIKEVIGLNTKRMKRDIAGARNMEAESIYKQKGIPAEKMNSRQVFQMIKGNNAEVELDCTVKCDEHAPGDINVYTDGSYINTRRCSFALSGAGVWWPGWRLDSHPLTNSEYQMAWEEQTPEGLSMHIALAGFGGSSTRAEIAAGIVALQSSGPVHVGTDSQAFLTKALASKS